MFWKIVKGDYSMDKSDWEPISDEAKQLVADMVSFLNMFASGGVVLSLYLAHYQPE